MKQESKPKKPHEILHKLRKEIDSIEETIRTSITDIQGTINIYKANESDISKKQMLEDIACSAEKLFKHCFDILELSRTSSETLAGSPENKPDVTNSKKAKRVLVIEDNYIAQKIAKYIIEALDCQLDIIDNGEYAIQFFTENHYDLVFVDLGLPDQNGHDIAIKIREIEKQLSLKPIPIIALSVHPDQEHKDKAIASGMTDYFVKPLTMEKCQLALMKITESNLEIGVK